MIRNYDSAIFDSTMETLDELTDQILEDPYNLPSPAWIDLYLKKSRNEWIEYDSMINLRPWQDNDSRGVDSPMIRENIREIVDSLVRES